MLDMKNTNNGLALTSDKLGNGWDILHWIASSFVNASLECFVAGPKYFNTKESVKGCARRLYQSKKRLATQTFKTE